MSNKKSLMLIILSIFMISVVIGAVSANSSFEENYSITETDNTVAPLSDMNYLTEYSSYSDESDYSSDNVETTVDDGTSDSSSDDDNENIDEETPEYDGEFIVENITQKYDGWGSDISVWLQDNDENPLILGDGVVTLHWSDGTISKQYDNDWYNLEIIADEINYGVVDYSVYDYWLYDDDEYEWEGYYSIFNKPVGTYTVTAVCNDDVYNIKPATFTVKINKGTVKLTPKAYHCAKGDYATLKCNVVDSYGQFVDEGTVTFKIDGKEYKVKVSRGVATKKIKLSKAKTYKYTATFNGDNYVSKSGSSSIYVYKITKKARTFKIGKYKAVVPLAKYKKLINAKNTNKRISFHNIYTGKKITQKVKVNGKWKTMRNVKVYFNIAYGGKTGGQDCNPNKYCIYLGTKYQNPGYDDFKPWVDGYKTKTLLTDF
ncbi:MAG: Ig-like domain repeat protein [Clostridia bacterium]|nr:Ig-like domain repeat protein [Clostridia bacterium]